MTTSATTPRLNYTGDGSTTDFTFNYEIADQNSIAVYVGSTRQTLTTDYTVAFNSGTAGTGTVTFLSAPANAADIHLIRETDNIRTTDFQEGGAFLAATINNELDRLTQGLQDLENIIENTTIKIAEPTTETPTLTLPDAATRANKQLRFDGSGDIEVTSAGTGTVTSLATGTGLTGGPITTTGTISIDSTVATLTGTQTLTNKTMGDDLDVNNNRLLNVATPSASTDGTNKNYVDGLISGRLANVVEDSTPQLGGNLDLNSNNITGTGDINITGEITGTNIRATGNLTIDGTTTTLNSTNLSIEDAFIELNRNNSSTATDADAGIFIRNGYTGAGTDYNPAFYWDHGDQKFRFMITDVDPNTSPASLNDGSYTLANVQLGSLSSGPITASASKFYGITFMNNNSQDALEINQNNITGLRSNDDINITPAGTGTVNISSLTLPTGSTVTAILDQDTMASNSATALATQQSIKAYVDGEIGGIYPIIVASISEGNSNVTVADSGTGSITVAADGNNVAQFTNAAGLTMSRNIAMGGNSITGLDSLTATGSIANDAVSIDDNVIKTTRSNDNLNISANGTGQLVLSANGSQSTFINGTRNVMYHKDHAATFGTRGYANLIVNDIKIDSGQADSSDSNDRWRNYMEVNLDLNGKDSTSTSTTYMSNGPNNFIDVNLYNSGATDSSLGNAVANNNFIYAETTNTGSLTVGQMASNTGSVEAYANGGAITFTDARIYNTNAEGYGGAGTENIGTLYHFKANAATGFNSITDEWGFHTPDSMKSLIGGVTLQDGDITTGAVSITDNKITATRSNDNLFISANGTGAIHIAGDDSNLFDSTLYNNMSGSPNQGNNIIATVESVDAGSIASRSYNAIITHNTTLTGSGSHTDFRPRAIQANSNVDLAGFDYTHTGASRGPVGATFYGQAENSGAGASTLATLRGLDAGAYIQDYNSHNQDITVTNAYGVRISNGIENNGTGALTFTNAYDFYANSYTDNLSSGSSTITNHYAFYTPGTGGTNNYAFYSASDTAKSRVGSLERYREEINTLTSSSTITVDCGLAPVHTVTLGHNTEFNISNLGTGQSVTLIITQDGTGNRTASFGTDTSTAVKFPGGVPSLSTGGGDIDIITIFNDGTNHLGNIQKDYS